MSASDMWTAMAEPPDVIPPPPYIRDESVYLFVAEMADAAHVSTALLFSDSRTSGVVELRFRAMHAVRERFGYTPTELGKFFRRDRTSVVYGLKRGSALHLGTQGGGR